MVGSPALLFTACTIFALMAFPTRAAAQTKTFPLDSVEGLKLHNVTVEPVTYKGRKAIRVLGPFEPERAAGIRGRGRGEENFVILQGLEFSDGIIEVDIAGEPRKDAGANARGFIGIVFRMAPDHSQHERFYLRPTNGRSEDQARRNHSVQYVSFPDFPWQKLRSETPSKYETYVDLVPGEWTRVKIEVQGEKARLYVHGVEQPTLLVNDLKLGADARGAVALWINPTTTGHFTNLRISPWE